jgi:predicted metal-dependent hydrolase
MTGLHAQPLILGFVADLMFAVKIEQIVTKLDYRVKWIERAGQITPQDDDSSQMVPGESQFAETLSGPGTNLLDLITLDRPALIIFDLSNAQIPWRRWIALVKSVPSTRRIPVICFGSHVEVETMQAARSAGADAVLARSRFSADLPGLIHKYASIPDYAAIEAACQLSLSAKAIQGLEEFNRGEYFEAHEFLEAAWNEDDSVGCELYRAILQIAVAYLQITRQNYNGAMKMFLRVRQWMDPLPGECRGVDIDHLREDSEQVRRALVELGSQHMAEFDLGLLKPVKYTVDG